MSGRVPSVLLVVLAPLWLAPLWLAAPLASSARANEGGGEHAGGHGGGEAAKEKKPPQTEPDLPGRRSVQIRKPTLPQPKPPAVEGLKGVESYCGAIAASADSERLAWQEQRIKQLQVQLDAKIVEVAAKTAELRGWVEKREQLLARASAAMVAIYAKMSPEAAASHLREMDDDAAAALLLKLKPSTASAVMNEMDAARAARLADLLTGAQAKTAPPPPPPPKTDETRS